MVAVGLGATCARNPPVPLRFQPVFVTLVCDMIPHRNEASRGTEALVESIFQYVQFRVFLASAAPT